MKFAWQSFRLLLRIVISSLSAMVGKDSGLYCSRVWILIEHFRRRKNRSIFLSILIVGIFKVPSSVYILLDLNFSVIDLFLIGWRRGYFFTQAKSLQTAGFAWINMRWLFSQELLQVQLKYHTLIQETLLGILKVSQPE